MTERRHLGGLAAGSQSVSRLVDLGLDRPVAVEILSGGSSPPRSVPAISSSDFGSAGTKPDFMPK